MKKIRYVATMTVEFEITEEMEREIYQNGLSVETLKEEMKSDSFDELFYETLSGYKADGYLIENGQVIAHHKEVFKVEE